MGKLNVEYVDLDAYIEIQEKKTIPVIFKEKGEIYFRKQETLYLKEVLSVYQNVIISLGGGTPCFAGNIEYILANHGTRSVYLQTSLDELSKRLFDEKEQRPLLAHIETEEGLKDFIRKHLFERSYYYNQASHKVITDTKTIEEVAQTIQSLQDHGRKV